MVGVLKVQGREGRKEKQKYAGMAKKTSFAMAMKGDGSEERE